MTQVIDALPAQYSNCILCSYLNATSQVQITRITNIPNWYFERVVFPGERLLFESMPEAELEIHRSRQASAVHIDVMQCGRLQVFNGNWKLSDKLLQPPTVNFDAYQE